MVDNLALVVTHGMLLFVLFRLFKAKEPGDMSTGNRATRQEPRRRA